MSANTCPHCGAAHLYVKRGGDQFACGTFTEMTLRRGKLEDPKEVVRSHNCRESELAALREQLAAVTKELDEARAKAEKGWEFARVFRRFASIPDEDMGGREGDAFNAASDEFDKLEGGEG